MSLPKKRKRLNENQTTGKDKPEELLTSSLDIGLNEKTYETPTDSARNKQMIKAFEIVEHIEQVHGITGNNEQKPTDTSLISSRNNQDSVKTKRLQVKVSFNSTPGKELGAHDLTSEEDMPVIEVKFKIPSFFQRVPILKGLAGNLIRRFAKE
jgi:hypothetical protein